MLLNKSQIFISSVCALGLFLGMGAISNDVLASAPHVRGVVTTDRSGTPVGGLWVKWEDKHGNIRYVQTSVDENNVGRFYFESWHELESDEIKRLVNNDIDIDFDGQTDTKQAVLVNFIEGEDDNDMVFDGFDCGGTGLHRISVIKPHNWDGYFSPEVQAFDFTNQEELVILDNFVWNPNPVSVSGWVRDGNGNVLVGQTVRITSSRAGISSVDSHDVKTNSLGYYLLSDFVVPGDRYTVTVVDYDTEVFKALITVRKDFNKFATGEFIRYSKNVSLGLDTKVGDTAYVDQVLRSPGHVRDDCAGPDAVGAAERCNFVLDRHITTCSAPAAPENLRVSGKIGQEGEWLIIAPGEQTISWDPVDGATAYRLRVDYDAPSWVCYPIREGDVCADIVNNSYTYNFQKDGVYHVWVHSMNLNPGYCNTSYQTTVYVKVQDKTVTSDITPEPILH